MLFGIDPDELKMDIYIETCTQMFIATLLLTARTWR